MRLEVSLLLLLVPAFLAQVCTNTFSIAKNGTTFLSITPDGTVTIPSGVLSLKGDDGFSLGTSHTGSFSGSFFSAAVTGDGLPLVTFYDEIYGDLKVLKCKDPNCVGTSTFTVDSLDNVGKWSSVAKSLDGFGIISYYDVTSANLKVAKCLDFLCSNARISVIDSAGDVGSYSSVTVGGDGFALISYFDATNGDLKVAHCLNGDCTSVSVVAVHTAGVVGQFTSITKAPDGFGLISYQDVTNLRLVAAKCGDANCTNTTRSLVDATGNVGQHTSIGIGSDGFGLISYYGNGLKVAHCSNADCTVSTVTSVDSAAGAGFWTSLAIGVDGFGIISYQDTTSNSLKVAHCSNPLCNPSSFSTLDSAGGNFTKTTIRSNGLPIVFYLAGKLFSSACDDVTCSTSTKRSIADNGRSVFTLNKGTRPLFQIDEVGNIISQKSPANGQIGAQCVANSDCITGYSCSKFRCFGGYLSTCTTSQQCAEGFHCGSGVCYPKSCHHLKQAHPELQTGVYFLWPEYVAANTRFYCSMEATTGWTLVWSNLRGGTGKFASNLTWDEALSAINYTGTPSNNLESWTVFTGLSHWHSLAPQKKIRYDWSPAYLAPVAQRAVCNLSLNPARKYTILVVGCTNLVGSVLPGLATYHSGFKFSTVDMDNDQANNACSPQYSGTPWWYGTCWSGNFWGGGEEARGYQNAAYWTGSDNYDGVASTGQGGGNGWLYIA